MRCQHMLGYYQLTKEQVKSLPKGSKNLEDNIYDLCCPLITNQKEKLDKNLLCLYEVLAIPILSYEEAKEYDYDKIKDFSKYIETFSSYLKMNVPIELLEEEAIGHLLRVAKYAKDLAEKVKLEKEMVKNIYIASLFHDIGKYLIPDEIISKKGKLTDEEFALMKEHSKYGCDILNDFLNDEIIEIIHYHHERCDQSGYPNGIVPNIGAKILGIADSYDAMTSSRVYHKIKSREEAIKELLLCTIPKEEGGKGVLYDRNLVENFIEII